ncbi:MAG: chemotaxis protein CheA [Spirochaetales bacterium]|nr:chemotaxis protein CheA [Spirochaetales bacterium]
MSDYLDPNNEELLNDFFEEAQLQIDLLEQNILVLEDRYDDKDAVDELFRAAHTLKGAAATVQMNELAEFTHSLEDVLDMVRSGDIVVDEQGVDVFLSAIDIIKAMIESREEGNVYQDSDIADVKKDLVMIMKGNFSKPATKSAKTTQVAASKPAKIPQAKALPTASKQQTRITDEYEYLELFEIGGKDKTIYEIIVKFNEDTLMNTVGGIQVYTILKRVGTVLKTEPDFEDLNEDIFHPEVIYYIASTEDLDVIEDQLDISDVITSSEILVLEKDGFPADQDDGYNSGAEVFESDDEVEEVFQDDDETDETPVVAVKKKSEPKAPKAAKVSTSILRVESRRIDNLLNMVSESVINKSTINRISTDLAETLAEIQTFSSNFEYELRSFVDTIPDLLRQLDGSANQKDLLAKYRDRFDGIFSELHLYENNFKKNITDLKNTAQKLSINTGNLQEGIMKIRMVPVSNIFSRFPRLVRDLSHSLSKKVNLVLEGEDTELDKSVIEDLLDPLIHCVRNSVDHGIEQPDVRRSAGKPDEGTVVLKASNEGSMIIIEIVDDGAGINKERVKRKAIEKGLIKPDVSISDNDVYNLLFLPGFSTADNVTDVSGRGVGMDVVKTQIEKLKGSITVTSTEGQGTKFSIRLPLTLSIIQGLLVKVGSEIYSIPVTNVVDSHRVSPGDINFVDNYEVFNVREEVIFVVRLHKLFNIPSYEESTHKYIVIVSSGDKKMGLVVDALIGEEDVVIKPLKDDFSNTPGIAGATILGDGKVSLIVDVSRLLELGATKHMESKREMETKLNV